MGSHYPHHPNFNQLAMEYTEGAIKERAKQPMLHSQEYEQAGNSYLMAVVAVIMGLPLPIINLIATVGYYLAYRKAAYFVRWHCIQAAIGQVFLIPFNSVAIAWTLGMLFRDRSIHIEDLEDPHFKTSYFDGFFEATSFYWIYIGFIIILNITEFFVVIYTASRVKNGHNVRWFIIAPITDALCSKEDRNPYKL